MSKSIWVHLALGTVALLYAINYILAKEIMPQPILPFGLIVVRATGATLLFWLFSFFRKWEKIEKKYFIKLVFCALFGVVINQLLFFKGLSITSPINASIILTTTPILVLVISAILLGEKITPQKLLGILLGITGAFFLIGGTQLSFSNETAWGDMLIFINAVSYGIYLVLVKPLMNKYEALTVIRWVFLIGLFFIVPLGWSEFVAIDWLNLPNFAYAIVIYIVVGVTFLVYLLNAWGLCYVNASVVGFYIYLKPLLTVLVASYLGKDSLTWFKVLFSLMIFVGVYLVSSSNIIKKAPDKRHQK